MSQHQPIGDDHGPTMTAEDVSRRVADWLLRLDGLYKEVKAWAAANGWSTKDGTPIPMYEEPMERLGVSECEQPSLSVRSPDGAEIWVKPKGLWVIGVNGRVDLFSRKGAFTLVDVADEFEAPRWILHRIGKRGGQQFEPDQLADMV